MKRFNQIQYISALNSFINKNNTRIALIICLVVGLVSHYAFIVNGVDGKEDNILFYMNGLNIVHGKQLNELNQRAIDYYTDKRVDRHALVRLNFRKDFLNEFIFPGALYFAVSRTFKPLFDITPKLYPLFLTLAIVLGFIVCFVALFAFVIIVFWTLDHPVFIWALTVTVLLFGLSELLPVQENTEVNLIWHPNAVDSLQQLGQILLRPSSQFSFLSFTPRSNFALLTIAIFALRWRGLHFCAYLLVLLGSFVHLATSGVVLLLLVVVDLALRPTLFKRPAITSLTLVTGTTFFIRETMWEFVAQNEMALVALIIMLGILLGIYAGILLLPGRLADLGRRLRLIRSAFLRQGAIVTDIVLIMAIWVTSIIILYVTIFSSQSFDKIDIFYFWGRVHGRVLMVLWPSVVFGITVLILDWVSNKCPLLMGRIKMGSLVVVLLLVLLVAWASLANPRGGVMLTRVANKFIEAEERLDRGQLTTMRVWSDDELVLYYAISKTVDTGKDVLGQILK